MAELCVNVCLYQEDVGCVQGQPAAASKCVVEAKGKTLVDVEAFLREELKKLPPDPRATPKPRPRPSPSPRRCRRARPPIRPIRSRA
jgi:hypothetical protein